MTIKRTVGVALAVLATAFLTTVPAGAADLTEGYHSLPFDSTLYLVRDSAQPGHQHGIPRTYAEWRQDGSPRPTPVPVTYLKYPWSDVVVAELPFAVQNPNNHPGAVGVSGTTQNLSFRQWDAAGRPAATPTNWMTGSQIYHYESSPELFVTGVGVATPHKLTLAQWTEAGRPPGYQSMRSGFYRYAWSPQIGYVLDTATGDGIPLDRAGWASWGFPTPRVVTNIAGEVVWRQRDSETLYLSSAIVGNVPLTHAQWTALGRPAPRLR